ncbi:MAG: GlsB/YeaQ/YmgE family stress response membrane protein [Melioribacteraceae bacterium]|nr:MAG: GlsB/YeaQ/YmgE family stress response membrane protein [Melioribacteraceae bacterium]
MNFIIWILSGILAGWLTGKIMKGSGYGLLGDLAIGLLGAVVGGFLAGLFGLEATSWVGQIVVAVVGGIVLVWVVRKIKG